MHIDEKELFLERLMMEGIITDRSRILEVGCGQAKAVARLLEKFPQMTYVGVEPYKRDADIAKKNLERFSNAKILEQSGYESTSGSYDVCISLSVLEHVRQLEKFLSNSAREVAVGGYVVHRYDLGHSLYPSSIKESFQIWLGNHFPKILPENKFCAYVDSDKVEYLLTKNGLEIIDVTYHQMPNHKRFLKFFNIDSEDKRVLAEEIIDWEFKVSKYLPEIEKKNKEKLFPSVSIWAKKTK